MTNTQITDQYDSVGRDWYYANAVDRAYGNKANTVTRFLMDNCEIVYHGGQDSVYPAVEASINNTNWYDIAVAGTLEADTPNDTDLTNAAHQEGWGFFDVAEAISQKTRAINTGSHSKRGSETIIDQKLLKWDALANRMGCFFERSYLDGDGTNNTILGMSQVFDITNTNYLGMNLSTATYKPYNVTIATNQNSLAISNLIDVYTELEDEGMYIDSIICHPDAIKRLRNLTQATVEYSPGGKATFGHTKFDVIGAKIRTSRYMPTTTSTKIYFLNSGNHPQLGIAGKDNPKVSRGNYWILEFAGPAPLGYELSDWHIRRDYKGMPEQIRACGAKKMACPVPERQGYISIA